MPDHSVFVVLGMHRSGTSAITRGLQALNVNLGEQLLLAVSNDNDKGFFEDIEVNKLNIDLLNAIDCDWDSLSIIPATVLSQERLKHFKVRAVELICSKIGERPFGLKDPRIARLLPFWQSVFDHAGVTAAYVIAVRNPMSIAKSLTRRNGFDAEKSYYLWLGHVIPAILQTHGYRRVAVNFDLLISEPYTQLSRIARSLDLPFDSNSTDVQEYVKEFLDANLRHAEFNLDDLRVDGAAPADAASAYEMLLRLAGDEVEVDAPEVGELFEQLRANLAALHPVLNYMTHSERRMVERNGQIASLNGEIGSLNGLIAGLNGQVTSLVVVRDYILNSASWKITKPLRLLYPILISRPRHLICHIVSNSARHVLQELPISYQHKQALRESVSHGSALLAAMWRRLWHVAVNASRAVVPNSSSDGAETSPSFVDPYAPPVLTLGSTNRFLLVVHELSLTGAPRAVLFLARALFLLHGVRPVIISPCDGPMREEFEGEGFPTVVDTDVFRYRSYSYGACNFVMGFEKVIVTSLASHEFIRHFRGIARHLSWWIHETEAGFTSVRKATADLALLFASCESIWLGSPICSQYALQYASREKLHVLLYGCEDEAPPPLVRDNKKVVFSIFATVEPRKGHDIFLDAVTRLPEAVRRKGMFRIIGSPREFGESQVFFKRIRAAASLIEEVEYIPHVPHDRLIQLYAETDVMVSASRDDPMPIVVTQGLMLSKVCLCSSAIGHAQLLQDGKDGLIFPGGSAGILSEKMEWILSNPHASSAIGLAGRKVYERYFRMDTFVRNVDVAQRMQ